MLQIVEDTLEDGYSVCYSWGKERAALHLMLDQSDIDGIYRKEIERLESFDHRFVSALHPQTCKPLMALHIKQRRNEGNHEDFTRRVEGQGRSLAEYTQK